MSAKKSSKYVFILSGVNIEKTERKFGLESSNISMEEEAPQYTTTIESLNIIKKAPESISFANESKQLCRCYLSTIDFDETKKYNCYWDKHPLPIKVQPIGCPIRYIPNKIVKTYYSEISKDHYTIVENITKSKKNEISAKNQTVFTMEEAGHYETDGIFCSFNCCMAWILDNAQNPLYRLSEQLLLKMYTEYADGRDTDREEFSIIPAGHWRLLEEYGGGQSIEKFRENFNKIHYTDKGILSCQSIGRLYEDRMLL